jgi:tRNA(fMet)-specific endonuclease VapC
MAAYVLDTTTITHLSQQHPHVTANLLAHSNDTVVVTAVTVDESLGGWYHQLRSAKTNAQRATAYEYLSQTMTVIGQFQIIPPSEAALDDADRLFKARLNVGRMDLKIAAVALEIGATVVTDNRRDFGRVPGLVVEDWTV